jgi:hypothetical protein
MHTTTTEDTIAKGAKGAKGQGMGGRKKIQLILRQCDDSTTVRHSKLKYGRSLRAKCRSMEGQVLQTSRNSALPLERLTATLTASTRQQTNKNEGIVGCIQ